MNYLCPCCGKKTKDDEHWPFCNFVCSQWSHIIKANIILKKLRLEDEAIKIAEKVRNDKRPKKLQEVS